MASRRLILGIFIAMSWMAFCGLSAFAQENLVDVQYRRKAEMLYPLAALIQSEKGFADGGETLVIGVLGKDPFQGVNPAGQPENHLDAMVAESNARTGAKRRKHINVKRFVSASDYTPCHILLVSAQAATSSKEMTLPQRLTAALEKTKDSPVLICTDTEGYAQKGAMLNFYLGKDSANVAKVMFEFNPDAAKRAGFTKIDAGIYRLGTIIRDSENAERSGPETK